MNKIGFDIHGVIDQNPQLFSKIIKQFRKLNYEIHILTGSLIDGSIKTELKGYDVEYDHIFSILEYHKNKDTEMWTDENGRFWIDDNTWNETKAKYCNKHKLSFHIDDTLVYGKYFDVPFGHITPTDRNPRIIEIKGDLNDQIIEVLKDNEGYYKLSFI